MYASTSPYAYCGNDPVNFTDFAGLTRTYNYATGQWEGTRGVGDFGYFTGENSGGGSSFPKMCAGLKEAGPKPTNKQLDDYIAACNNPYAPFKGSLSDYIALTNSPASLGGVSYSIGTSWAGVTGSEGFKGYYLRKIVPSLYSYNSMGYFNLDYDSPNSSAAYIKSENNEWVGISDKSIVTDLMNYDKKTRLSKTTRSSKFSDDLYKLFKFAADNSVVEWRIDKLKNGNYTLGTWHRVEDSPSSVALGHTENDVINMLHSHGQTSAFWERSSMGETTDGSSGGDNFISTPYKRYAYFSVSQNLYEVTKKSTNDNGIKLLGKIIDFNDLKK